MKLSADEVKQFYRLHGELMCHVYKNMNKGKTLSGPAAFRGLSLEEINELRGYLFDHQELIDSFLKEKGRSLPGDEYDIVQGWKQMIPGEFFLMRHLKNYSVFMDKEEPAHVYGVLPLIDEFENLLGPELPVYLETVLLPFKGKIVYDGIFIPYNVFFGGNMKRSLNQSYQKGKATFGVITSLPFDQEETQGEAKLLKYYLRTSGNRAQYEEEIDELRVKDPEMELLYHQLMGKKAASGYKKQFQEMGVGPGWFAILEETVIACGRTKAELEEILRDIIREEKRELVHVFRIKG